MLHSGHGSIRNILAPMACLCESTTHEDGAIMHDDTLVVASNFASGFQLLQHELSVSCVCGSVYAAMLCVSACYVLEDISTSTCVEMFSYLRMTLILEATHF